MKKLFQWLTGSVVKEIGNAIDKLTTTEEEKLIIKKQVQEILEQADNNAQIQVTDRWKSDMASDSYLIKKYSAFNTYIYNGYIYSFSIHRWKHWRISNSKRVYTYISNIISYCLRSLFCRKNLGKSNKNK